MKQLTLLIILATVCTIAKAQSGQGYKFTYDPAGYRIKRDFHTNHISYIKPGRESETDTLIGAFEKDDALSDRHEVVVKAYPNPTQDVLHLENFSWKQGSNARISVFDVNGKKVIGITANTPKKEISLKALAPGTYQVNYQLSSEKFFTWKIVKL